MDNLKAVLIREVSAYAKKGYNCHSYLTTNADQSHLVVFAIGMVHSKRIVNTSLIVELIGDTIIIDEDINTKPLVDALVQAGVPREQIILAYEGEPVPEPA
ncbi:MAG: element excision factor XisI family protein [Aggregatilineales bacterium]